MAWFHRVARWAAHWSGTPQAFLAAVTLVIVWLLSGPLFGFSDTWQLVINTGTTIVTFLMVFLIQSTQNQDTTAIQIKLDELIRSNRSARNSLLDLEELTDEELQIIRNQYEDLAKSARQETTDRADSSSPASRTPP